MKCRQCGKEITRKGAERGGFCSKSCAAEYAAQGNDEAVTVVVVKVPQIYEELRPRRGEVLHTVRRKGYNSTAYIYERAGKKVLLRADEVVEVNTVLEAGQQWKTGS